MTGRRALVAGLLAVLGAVVALVSRGGSPPPGRTQQQEDDVALTVKREDGSEDTYEDGRRVDDDGTSAKDGGRREDEERSSGGGEDDGAESVPGEGAEKPTEIPAAGWKQILKRAWAEGKDDHVPLLAGGVAYNAFLALFPALIAAVTLYGLFASPEDVQSQVESLASGLPEDAASLLERTLSNIADGSDGALGIGLVVSVAGALFAASAGMQGLMKAVNAAYDEDETRGFLKLRGTALLLTFGAIVFVLVAIGIIAVLPVVFDAIGLGSFATILLGIARFVGLALLVVGALAVVYRYAPDRDDPQFAWTSLGAVAATVVWILASLGFSLYVNNFGSYGETYGALAGVVVLLIWLYLTAYIVLLGAEINSESEQQTKKDTTKGEPKPIGERDAVKADTGPRDA